MGDNGFIEGRILYIQQINIDITVLKNTQKHTTCTDYLITLPTV